MWQRPAEVNFDLDDLAAPDQTEGLTNWDKAYLQGLYGATRTLQNRRSSRTEIAASIVRAHHDINAAEDGSDAP